MSENNAQKLSPSRDTHAPHTDIAPATAKDIAGALTALLADVFGLYIKTKHFHWHMSGPHFRDYHLLLDEQGNQLFAMTDESRNEREKSGKPRYDLWAISPE